MTEKNRLIELDDLNAWPVTTEAFLAQIHRSSELLRQGQQEEARRLLEEAFESRVDDAYGQATLALVYFKLGIYPRALSIYLRLVTDFPNEPTLRLNLGLIYLKTGQTDRAVRELESVVRLSPGYRKAHGYLGLAYQRLGDYRDAKNAFEIAGATHLAERMARFIAPDAVPIVKNERSSGSLDLSYATPKRTDDGEKDLSGRLTEFLRELPFASAAPSPLRGDGHHALEPVPVSDLTSKARLPEPLTGRFLISEAGYLLMDVENLGFARLDGLHFLIAEKLSYKPLMRKYRGRACDEIFGGNENPMFEIEGSGRLGFHPQEKHFSAISLDGDVVYIREELLFAIDPVLSYENGRIPGDGAMLVHLRGRGAIVLQTPSPPSSLEVTPSRGVVIPKGDLVGWFGRLLPRPAVNSPFDAALGALEMVGEGVLLICLS